ncbi:protein Mpv17-like [Tropilaelaps mercedesae]|uniref:Mitochondrial inner membrane protein Mpv17 n=1 Tax=Tropilaelaps mercedesae TaxID=418985 RepID=A0A1V9XT96_9ACAR|nr:protein Mpv17-like [Tropilaelaps mercedesae]
MSRFYPIRLYLYFNTKYPASTQVLTTATLMASSDVLAQKVIEKRQHINPTRTARFFFVGCVYVGPILRTWYPRLDRLVSHSSKLRGFKMVFIDQGLFTPIFVPGFLATLSTFQGQSFDEMCRTVKAKTIPILVSNWMVWPAAQIINFNFVPLQFRVLFASTVALFWNTYLAWKANQDRPEKTDLKKMITET